MYPGKVRPFYHLPPTAVSIKVDDVRFAFKALSDPENALKEFIDALVHRVGNTNCYVTDSGRSALLLILQSIKTRSQRTKVILPAYSCPTVAQAVLQAGLQPVFCDMSVDTLDMDRDQLKELLDNQTLAIIPTHLYGLPVNVRDLVLIGRASGTYIIEDAAQAFGAEIGGKPVGTIGDFGFYSMGRGKCIPTGHGGVILARDAFAGNLKKTIDETISGKAKTEIASIASYLAYGLATTPFGWWFIVRSPMNPANAGMDYKKLPPITPRRISPAQAGIGASILNRIDPVQRIRQQNAQILKRMISRYSFIKTPGISPGSSPSFLRFPIIIEDKSRADRLFCLLSKAGIGVSRSYTRSLPEIFSKQRTDIQKRFPGAQTLADCLLTLPVHHLTDSDLTRIESAFNANLST